MRWIRVMALAVGLAGGLAFAQEKPPPLEPPAAAPTPGFDKFGEPLPAAPPPVDELPAVARFRALLGHAATLTYRAAEPIDPATGSVRLLGVVLAREGGKAAIEELTLDGLGEDRIGAASAREVTVTGGDGVLRIARLDLRGLAAPGQAPQALMLDSLRLETLTLEGDMPVALAEAVLEDVGRGRPARASLSGLDLLLQEPGMTGRLRIGRVGLRGIDLGDLVDAMDPPPGAPLAEARHPVLLELEQASVATEGREVGSLGTLRLEAQPTTNGVDAGRLALRDLRIEPVPPIEDWLRRFGYPALLGDLTGEVRFDRTRQRLDLVSLALAGREMGVLGLSFALEGVTPEAMEQQDWEALRLAGVTLRYLDQSLYGRALRDQARRLRQPEQRLREQWAGQAAAALGAGSGRAPAPVAAALQRFLRGEAKEVEISARPPQPLPLGQVPAAFLGGPAEMQRVLGLGAVAR
ncbi:hypothetical protein [Paracraurococcus lichenis]|uniref:DUF748 domain-containing protein n=1 Tax=Paracraurococcus lichenis TaxID=3064888 RepID=A0ABT9EBG5_9PROT|nr:hypothetical protein [Paracraurococcus sp. LOR1-02]MDO9713538.1 hypothetical protein [Paracraurococcus sp. LOR1-02]